MEYAGYVAPDKTTDWAALTGQLAGKLDSIGKDRTAQKEALDAKAQDAEAYINSIESTKSQSANQILNDFGYTGKGQLLKWNKDLKAGILSPKEYNNNIATLNDYTSTFANSLKTFDQRYQEVLKRQESGEASAYELELANRFGQIANLQNAKIQVSDSGRVYMSKVDPNTGEIIDDLIDVRTINLPENIVANKVDVAGQTSKLMEGWSPDSVWKDLGKGGDKTIESLRLNDAYKLMRANLAETVANDNNPRAQISVLVDNGVINADYYINDAEYKQKKAEAIERAKKIKQTAGLPMELSEQEMKDIELSMVKLEKDAAGIINPVPSDDQKKAAKERVMQEVDMNAGEKITGSSKQDWYHAPTGNGNDVKQQEDNYMNGYIAVRQAWHHGDYGMLSKNYQYVPKGNGVIEVYETTESSTPSPDGKTTTGKTTRKLVQRVTSIEGLAQFAFDTKNSNEALTYLSEGEKVFRNRGLDKDPKYAVNKSMSEAEWNKKWAKLKPGQQMVGLDGKTYTKK